MDEVDPPHGADFRGVIDEADVPLGGSVELSDLDVAEAIQELRPNVHPDPVADSDPNFVILFIVSLQNKKKKDIHTQSQKQSLVKAWDLVNLARCWSFFSPWESCRGSALFHRYTASPLCCTSCSRPRTGMLRTFSSDKCLSL